jgi:hypothetical protein
VCVGKFFYHQNLCPGEPKTRKSDSGFSALLHFFKFISINTKRVVNPVVDANCNELGWPNISTGKVDQMTSSKVKLF